MKDELFIKQTLEGSALFQTLEGSALLKLLHAPSDPIEREVMRLK